MNEVDMNLWVFIECESSKMVVDLMVGSSKVHSHHCIELSTYVYVVSQNWQEFIHEDEYMNLSKERERFKYTY